MSCKRIFWVLMHDGGGDRTQTILALEIILRELSGQGYTFKSLFGHGVEGAASPE